MAVAADNSLSTLQQGDTLLIIDVQNDFLAGGALAVSRADDIVPILNRYIELFARNALPIVATRDWHPPDHSSFEAQGGAWPVHCVAGSAGAQFSARLSLPANAFIVDKGTAIDRAGYSGFEHTELQTILQSLQCRRLFIGGLATDYCVAQTACDACRLGYRVVLLSDAMRAVDVQPGDGEKALAELRKMGAMAIELAALEIKR